MSPKNEDHGPGLLSALFLAFLTFIIGIVLGTASMVSQDVRILNRNANLDELDPGTVYYIRGNRLRATGWEAKEQALMSGSSGTLSFSESELNQWSGRRLRIEAPSGAADEAGWMDKLDVSANPLDFRIVDDQLLMTAELTVPGLLGTRSFLYQVKGSIVEHEGAASFIPMEGSLGCAPLGKIPAIKDVLFESVMSLYVDSEAGKWLPETLPEIASARISDGQLVLNRN